MSYREENGQVILTMSQDDYGALLLALGFALGIPYGRTRNDMLRLFNRLNSGNPHYTPYQVES
jgi:hypothetical protein